MTLQGTHLPDQLTSNCLSMLEAHCQSIGFSGVNTTAPSTSSTLNFISSPPANQTPPELDSQMLAQHHQQSSFYQFLQPPNTPDGPTFSTSHSDQPDHLALSPTDTAVAKAAAVAAFATMTSPQDLSSLSQSTWQPSEPYQPYDYFTQNRYLPLLESNCMHGLMAPYQNHYQPSTPPVTFVDSSYAANYFLAAAQAAVETENYYEPRASPKPPTLNTPAPSSGRAISGRRYASTRSNCECPNCQEIDLVASANTELAAELRRRSTTHSCHVPGCGKVYTKTSHLKAHLRWHTSECPFFCSWLRCGKRFNRSDELQRHQKEHASEKNLVCPLCHKQFLRGDQLNSHVRTHCDLEGKQKRSSIAGDETKSIVDEKDVENTSSPKIPNVQGTVEEGGTE